MTTIPPTWLMVVREARLVTTTEHMGKSPASTTSASSAVLAPRSNSDGCSSQRLWARRTRGAAAGASSIGAPLSRSLLIIAGPAASLRPGFPCGPGCARSLSCAALLVDAGLTEPVSEAVGAQDQHQANQALEQPRRCAHP